MKASMEKYIFRKAKAEDLPAIAEIYSKIHEERKRGDLYVGWLPGVYPTADTAKTALKRQDRLPGEEGNVLASAIINRNAKWMYTRRVIGPIVGQRKRSWYCIH